MPSREQPRVTVEKLRERIATLVKRSAEKFAEMKGIEARIDRLAAELSRANESETRARASKGRPSGT
jgi:hypothetical protein